MSFNKLAQSYSDQEIQGQHSFPEQVLSDLPASEKLTLIKEMRERIRPFITSWWSAEATSKDDQEALLSLPISEFLKQFSQAWDDHIEANKNTDRFIQIHKRKEASRAQIWSLQDWKNARSLMQELFETDHRKTWLSNLAKKRAAQEIQSIGNRYESDFFTSWTHLSYPSAYNLQHAQYYLNPSDELALELTKEYHCGDKELFALRLAELNYESMNISELESLTQCLEQAQEKAEAKRAHLEQEWDDDALALMELINYDQFKEYTHVYNYRWYSDVRMRDLVLTRLQWEGFFTLISDAL